MTKSFEGTWQVLRPGKKVGIGTPYPGMSCVIMNEQGDAVPFGELGELCMGATYI